MSQKNEKSTDDALAGRYRQRMERELEHSDSAEDAEFAPVSDTTPAVAKTLQKALNEEATREERQEKSREKNSAEARNADAAQEKTLKNISEHTKETDRRFGEVGQKLGAYVDAEEKVRNKQSGKQDAKPTGPVAGSPSPGQAATPSSGATAQAAASPLPDAAKRPHLFMRFWRWFEDSAEKKKKDYSDRKNVFLAIGVIDLILTILLTVVISLSTNISYLILHFIDGLILLYILFSICRLRFLSFLITIIFSFLFAGHLLNPVSGLLIKTIPILPGIGPLFGNAGAEFVGQFVTRAVFLLFVLALTRRITKDANLKTSEIVPVALVFLWEIGGSEIVSTFLSVSGNFDAFRAFILLFANGWLLLGLFSENLGFNFKKTRAASFLAWAYAILFLLTLFIGTPPAVKEDIEHLLLGPEGLSTTEENRNVMQKGLAQLITAWKDWGQKWRMTRLGFACNGIDVVGSKLMQDPDACVELEELQKEGMDIRDAKTTPIKAEIDVAVEREYVNKEWNYLEVSIPFDLTLNNAQNDKPLDLTMQCYYHKQDPEHLAQINGQGSVSTSLPARDVRIQSYRCTLPEQYTADKAALNTFFENKRSSKAIFEASLVEQIDSSVKLYLSPSAANDVKLGLDVPPEFDKKPISYADDMQMLVSLDVPKNPIYISDAQPAQNTFRFDVKWSNNNPFTKGRPKMLQSVCIFLPDGLLFKGLSFVPDDAGVCDTLPFVTSAYLLKQERIDAINEQIGASTYDGRAMVFGDELTAEHSLIFGNAYGVTDRFIMARTTYEYLITYHVPFTFRQELFAPEAAPAVSYASVKEVYDQYKTSIDAASSAFAIDKGLIVGTIYQESRGNPRAQATKTSAKGLMQLIDETAQIQGTALGYDSDISTWIFDPHKNIQAGTRYYTTLIPYCDDLSGEEYYRCLIAAYHDGPTGLARARDGKNKKAYESYKNDLFNAESQTHNEGVLSAMEAFNGKGGQVIS